ncbi:MAG: biotin synthase related protein [Oscillospiraceae bacterium]|nr:biotin synthase related protein [Oscillospiraceae bacterium]
MDLFDKLRILSDAAKYDAACTSSGVDRDGKGGQLGNAAACGICHSFSADGRCVSLLKVLMSNACIYNCAYCLNRASNDVPRATFSPRELADLTIHFYRRNYIEGLFLSSGIIKSPDYTCEKMIETLRILREEYGFRGYIHAKAIPGADDLLLNRLGRLADRMSVNIELPSQQSLDKLAPDKSRAAILRPMRLLRDGIKENCTDLVRYRHAEPFAPAGQSTQMIVGATPESDYQILQLTSALYHKFSLKRVFFSAYIPVSDNPLLPARTVSPPLLREHRLYQADWLLRFYGFSANEILDQQHPHLNPLIDPKCNWAINNMALFPLEVNTAPRELLLRVPGIGVNSTMRILRARRETKLDFDGLRRIGVVLKRAQYFVTCQGKTAQGVRITPDNALNALISDSQKQRLPSQGYEQLSLFSDQITREDVVKCISGQI